MNWEGIAELAKTNPMGALFVLGGILALAALRKEIAAMLLSGKRESDRNDELVKLLEAQVSLQNEAVNILREIDTKLQIANAIHPVGRR